MLGGILVDGACNTQLSTRTGAAVSDLIHCPQAAVWWTKERKPRSSDGSRHPIITGSLNFFIISYFHTSCTVNNWNLEDQNVLLAIINRWMVPNIIVLVWSAVNSSYARSHIDPGKPTIKYRGTPYCTTLAVSRPSNRTVLVGWLSGMWKPRMFKNYV